VPMGGVMAASRKARLTKLAKTGSDQ